jgi:hypothetical protein
MKKLKKEKSIVSESDIEESQVLGSQVKER